MLYSPYDYIFFKVYDFYYKKENPEEDAIFFLSNSEGLLVFIMLYKFLPLFNKKFKEINTLEMFLYSSVVGVSIYWIFHIINEFYFNKKKIERIIKKYCDTEGKKIEIFYNVFSIILVLIYIYLFLFWWPDWLFKQ